MAAGASSTAAMDMADKVYKKYGDIKNIDWAGPIKDQTDALTELANQAFQTTTTWSYAGGAAVGITDFTIDEGKKKLLYQQADKAAQIFNQALANAANPEDAKKIINQYMTAATSQWQTGFDAIMASNVDGSDRVKELFKKYGIDSGEAFAAGMRENGDFEKEFDDLTRSGHVNVNLQNTMTQAKEFAIEYEHAFINPLAKSSWYLSDGVMTAATALQQLSDAGIGLSSEEAVTALTTQNEKYKEYAALVQRVLELQQHGVPENSKEMLDLQNKLNAKGKQVTKVINELNQAYGFKQGRNATEALNNLMMKVKASSDKAKDSVDDLDKKIKSLPNRQTVTIQLKQVGGIMQSAMSSVQDQMASSAMDKFNAGWDATMASAQAAQERATNALQQRQQAAQDAMDRRFAAREDAINKAYDARIARIQREIKAEQDADETRQRLFEKEKARLQALADAENTNIDFNMQLNEGNLDEAAKTLNNAGVKSANDQMDAEQKAAEARTQARIDALEKKNDRLEKQRDKELKQLQKMEERMKRHLERVQNARANALAAEQEDYMNNLEARRNAEEALLEQKLELFKAFVPKNKKELDKWIHEIGLSWNTFGTDVLRKGKTWSDSFGDALRDATLQAGTEVASDNMWEQVGAKMADKLLKGFGFKGIADFRNFVRTGTLSQNGKGDGKAPETRHEGGIVGSGGGSRKGVPNTYKGLHRSEKMIRAQKGEYVVNKHASRANRDLLDAINSGKDTGGIGGLGDMGGGRLASISAGMNSNYGQGPAALAAGVMSVMLAKGINNAMQNAYNTGLSKQAALSMSGSFNGQAGTYGGRTFSAEQMKNAAIIASVGASMGMSKRDIEIGIMTAITESGLVNIRGGDRDSLGLFQQRPSMGWGSPAQIMDPKYAARAFFGPLKAHGERGDEAPWLAAQHIQRSAFSDGSNYAKWWAAAQQIFTRGLTRSKGGGYSAAPGGGFVAGAGGRHRPINGPVTNGLHGGSTAGNPPAVDMAGPVGRPVYAVADGVITSSRDIAGPLPTDTYHGDGPYGSFGRMITMNAAGNTILYAHLSRRSVSAGQQVKGGSVIGYSGNTGNSSGPHLHFGATNGPYAWLRSGGKVKYDNTPAMLHSGESVLTKRLTKQFEDSVAGSGGGDTFHVTLDLRGAMIKEDVDIERAVNKAIDARENKVGRKRVVK
jgi:murein DD-endopeptidase MepM/ murein hydrolase activator NlpD